MFSLPVLITGGVLIALVVGLLLWLMHLQRVVGRKSGEQAPLEDHIKESDEEARRHSRGLGRKRFRDWLRNPR